MEEIYQTEIENLVNQAIKPLGIKKRVIQAILNTPRHLFVRKGYEAQAYLDVALPIEEGQTISQPSLVALMTSLLELKGHEKVLEIGTGSGYQAAVLSNLAKKVYTVEIIPKLADAAKTKLKKLGYKNISVFLANGSLGLATHAPFDAIVVTAAAKNIPKPLINQLKNGGRLVIPLEAKDQGQKLTLVKKTKRGIKIKEIEPVVFVPLIQT